MNTKRTPTLTDVYKVLGSLDEKIDQIHEQVKYTNGRVTKLEGWKSGIDAVETYKKGQPQQPTQQEERGKWTNREKTLTGIILSLIALASAAIGAGKI